MPGPMKRVLTVILAVVLMVAVGASAATGTMAGFFDTETSKQNEFGAGTRSLEVIGGPLAVECGIPCKWYAEEFTMTNIGTLDEVATVHIPDQDFNGEQGLRCIEAGTVPHGTPPQEYVYELASSSYIVGGPINAGVASSEPESVAEEGGQFGQIWVAGFGADAGSDAGPLEWVMSRHVDVRMWFDRNGDGDFLDDGEMIVQGKLFDIACTTYVLGLIPAGSGSPSPDGVSRRFKIELHLPQIEDPAWAAGGVDYDGDGDIDEDDAQKRWWPTNVFQGDMCVFDLVFDAVKP